MTRSLATDSFKLGDRIARAIERHIAVEGLAIGAPLGTEDELASAFGVSRWILREAIAIAEMDGLIESRRGQLGGLFVAAPGINLRVATLRNYFSLAGASAEDINETRRVLEDLALRLAMRRITLSDVQRLRGFAELPEGAGPDGVANKTSAILMELLALSGNAPLRLFCLALAQSNIDRALWNGAPTEEIRRLSSRTWELRQRQVESIIANDVEDVLACQAAIAKAGISIHEEWNDPPRDMAGAVERASLLSRDYLFAEGVRYVKKPEAAARLLAQRILDDKLAPGTGMGSEKILLADLGISRNVLRESIRLLERFGVVRVQRGKEGGLRVIRHNPNTVVRATSLFLADEYTTDPAGSHRVSRELELLAATGAARRAQVNRAAIEEPIALFRAPIESAGVRAPAEEAFAHYNFLSAACGNPVVECLMQSLIFHIDFDRSSISPEQLRDKRINDALLCDAVEAGDIPLARRLTLKLREAGWRFSPKSKSPIDLFEGDDKQTDVALR